MLYQNNYLKKALRYERCGKGTYTEQLGMPWKRGSLLLIIVNEIYFIRDQSFWTKDFGQAFWFSRCVIIQERQPNQTCHENKKTKNKIMPSSMTIITVTQELSEARGCRKCSSTETKFKNTILPANITCVFIVTYITRTIQ